MNKANDIRLYIEPSGSIPDGSHFLLLRKGVVFWSEL